MYPVNLEPWFIKQLTVPEYGVVINRHAENETEVLVEENTWIIANKCLQLVGENDVHKVKQNK